MNSWVNQTTARLLALFLVLVLPLGLFAQSSKDQPTNATKKEEAKKVEVVRHSPIRLGGIFLGASYSHFSGSRYPFYSPCSPFYWDSWGCGFWPYYSFYPGFYPATYFPGFASPLHGGGVRLDTNLKTAEVYINGGYAGLAGKLKTFWLDPGVYELEMKSANRQPFRQRIYVLTGKTIRVNATLGEESKEVMP